MSRSSKNRHAAIRRSWSPTTANAALKSLAGSKPSNGCNGTGFRRSPAGRSASDPHQRGSVECLSVTDGELEVEVAGTVEHAKAGETLRYRCDRPHVIRNRAETGRGDDGLHPESGGDGMVKFADFSDEIMRLRKADPEKSPTFRIRTCDGAIFSVCVWPAAARRRNAGRWVHRRRDVSACGAAATG